MFTLDSPYVYYIISIENREIQIHWSNTIIPGWYQNMWCRFIILILEWMEIEYNQHHIFIILPYDYQECRLFCIAQCQWSENEVGYGTRTTHWIYDEDY